MMISFSHLARLPFVAIAVLMLLGCSSSSDRSRVQGTVRYNGEPVDEGGIAFMPEFEGDADENDPRVNATGVIQDGRYDLDSKRGPYPGKYRVQIYWNKKTGRTLSNAKGATRDVRKQAIPDKFNEKTELKVDVKPGRNTLDFDLKP